MGIISCIKHGVCGLTPSVSVDICNDLLNGGSGGIRDIYLVIVRVFDGEEHLYDQVNYISCELVDLHKLNRVYEIHNEAEEARINSFFPKTSVVCGKCFEEYIKGKNLIR